MGQLNPRHLDHQRALAPRDYATDPTLFGVVSNLGFRTPPGGTDVSMRIARLQHLLVCDWADRDRRPPATVLCRLFGFSKQVWSRVTTGERWAGETVLAALTHSTRTRPSERGGTAQVRNVGHRTAR